MPRNLNPASTEDKEQLLAALLKKKGFHLGPPTMIPRGPRQQTAPLTFAQQRLWFLDQLVPHSPFYNIAVAIHFDGALCHATLEQSLIKIVKRHDVLRTTFKLIEGQLSQVVAPIRDWTLPLVDLRLLAPAARDAEFLRLAAEEAQQPFNLAHGPLWRASLLKLDDTEHKLILVLHHIIADWWSLDLFVRELAAHYAPSPSPLPENPIQYTDFAHWQRANQTDVSRARQLDYWRQQLAAAPVLSLPSDRPRPAVQTHRGDWQSFTLPPTLCDQLQILSQQEKSTLFTTLLAAFKILLYRYSGQEDIVVGVPVAGRNQPQLETLIGLFVNTLPLRTDMSSNPSFRKLLAQVRQVSLAAQEHQDLPFEKLVQDLHPERDLSYTPLYQVMFAFRSIPQPRRDLPDLSLHLTEINTQTSKFDLTLFVTETETGLLGTLEYSTDLFDRATITSLTDHFQTLLAAIVARPEEQITCLPLLTEREQQRLLVALNDTYAPFPQEPVHRLFEGQVEEMPEALALITADEKLTYRALNNRANRLAHHLKSMGVGPETLVGLSTDRSADMIVGLLAILKAGGAYVPLDPGYPRERLNYMLTNAQTPILLTQERLLPSLPLSPDGLRVLCLDRDLGPGQSAENPTSRVQLDNLAYVIYTSGSTGKPKGIQISHRALTNFENAMGRQPGLTAHDILLAITTLSFDIAGLEIFLPLIKGARVVLASRAEAADGAQLLAIIQKSGATIMQATPITWQLMLEAGWQDVGGLKALCGGEAMPPELAHRLLPRVACLWNMYGPTETTIWSTCHRVAAPTGLIPIGRPIDNTTTYILDPHLRPVPLGVPGRLYIGGEGLARGYLRQPGQSAEKFIPHPFSDEPGTRLYDTGDMARYLADGTIEFLGRLDHQVKLHGFRIELGEIEAVLNQHPRIRQAVVTVRSGAHGGKHLVAYVVPQPASTSAASGRRLDIHDLRDLLRQHLPEHMVPAAFMELETLPLTTNGKINRKALPDPGTALLRAETTHVPPADQVEHTIAAIWQSLLDVPQVGVLDNFFDLGGNSLLATQVHRCICEALECDLAITEIFRYPSIRALAEHLSRAQPDDSLSLSPIRQRATTRWARAERQRRRRQHSRSIGPGDQEK